ncbi:MAG: DUF2600 family protein [Candidatus Eremiobacter antarcticus]|nr:DUF2600 family protein [Candidatus Eremiobacteraeota bacterium]MBC5807233.1 DUF2600 family protein [Candidatus Eremiobacteraeota bacterium]
MTSKRVRPGTRVVAGVVDQDLISRGRHFLIHVLPRAASELRRLKAAAARIDDAQLRAQALASIADKDFHVHGGCILATFLSKGEARRYVKLVAVFETAVDYLDNLCDRTGSFDESDFRALHESLIDAVTPGAPLRAYFRRRSGDDGGYLASLVTQSQTLFAALASFPAAAPYIADITRRYCELQALKHLEPVVREDRCREAFGDVDPGLEWWEGAAACGSTMPTFALAFAALQGCSAHEAELVHRAYFPYFSAFHILLDYFIDLAEDERHGELNFVDCYPQADHAPAGIARVGQTALHRLDALADADRHRFALRAMCAFYCTRHKIDEQSLDAQAREIAAAVGVDLRRTRWRSASRSLLMPLLELYSRTIGT